MVPIEDLDSRFSSALSMGLVGSSILSMGLVGSSILSVGLVGSQKLDATKRKLNATKQNWSTYNRGCLYLPR